MTSPLVSVLMPVYNARAYLAEALDSALSSTVDLELVAVDDGSSDGSSEVLADRAARDHRVVIIRHAENAGLLASLNAGLAEARGYYVARLDADDRCLEGRLEAQINAFRDVPELVLCWTDYERIDLFGASAGVIRCPTDGAAMVLALSAGNAILHSSVMMRRDAALAVGGYDARYFLAEDYHLWWRLLRHGRGVGLRHIGVQYRINPAGISQSMPKTQRDVARIVTAQARVELGCPASTPTQTRALLRDIRRRSSEVSLRHSGSAASQAVAAETMRQMFAATVGFGRARRWLLLVTGAPWVTARWLAARRDGRR